MPGLLAHTLRKEKDVRRARVGKEELKLIVCRWCSNSPRNICKMGSNKRFQQGCQVEERSTYKNQ